MHTGPGGYGNAFVEKLGPGIVDCWDDKDIYELMNRFVPTVYKRLSCEGVMTSKGDREDYERFWSEKLPAHLARLERLMVARQPAVRQPDADASVAPPSKRAKTQHDDDHDVVGASAT